MCCIVLYLKRANHTFQALVKMEDSPKPLLKSNRVPTDPAKKAISKRPKNGQLLDGVTENSAWRILIASLIHWAGTQSDPWVLSDAALTKALQTLVNTLYSGIMEITINTRSVYFHLVSILFMYGHDPH